MTETTSHDFSEGAARLPAAVAREEDGPAPITALPRLSKEIIVLIGLAMGLLVYGWMRLGGGRHPWATVVLLSAVLQSCVFASLALVQWRDRILVRCMVVVGAGLLALNTSVWWLQGDKFSKYWLFWQACCGVLLFIALAWVQALLQSRRLRAVRYSSLFTHAWNNAMVYAMVWQFVGLCWLVLALWAGLFMLVKVEFFAQTFMEPLFVCVATGVMGGIGVVLARGQPRAMQVQLQLVLALFRLLLPLLSLVVVLFVLALPFTGIEVLWATRKAAVLLVILQLCLLLFVNAVYQDGLAQDAPYPAPVRYVIHAALLLWPVLGALGVWAVVLRVQQYGWTHDRIWALVATALLLAYGLGYAWQALQRDRFLWLQGLGRFNARMSWVLMATIAVLHTPLLDVYRWSAHSQLQRLLRAEAPWEAQQLERLRFDHGRYGAAALQRLQQDPRAQEPPVQALVEGVLQAQRKSRVARAPNPDAMERKPLREVVRVAQGHSAPPQDWWEALEQDRLRVHAHDCQRAPVRADARCVVLQLALQPAGAPLPVLCRLGDSLPSCQVFERDAQQAWDALGRLAWGYVPANQRDALAQAIVQGQLQLQTPRWLEVSTTSTETPLRARVDARD